MPDILYEKKGRGQPKKDPSKILKKVVNVKFTDSGYEKIKEAADERGFTISCFIRLLAIDYIKANG